MALALTDLFLYSFSNFHVVLLQTLLMAIVAVIITKIHNVTHWFNCLSRNPSISKCSSLIPERLGFKMSLLMLKSSAGQFLNPIRKFTNPQIADSRFSVADFWTDFLPQTFAVKKLKSTANPQINNITGIVAAISKKIRFYDSMYR